MSSCQRGQGYVNFHLNGVLGDSSSFTCEHDRVCVQQSAKRKKLVLFLGGFLALIHNHAFVLFRSLLRDVLLCVAVDMPVTNAASFFLVVFAAFALVRAKIVHFCRMPFHPIGSRIVFPNVCAKFKEQSGSSDC